MDLQVQLAQARWSRVLGALFGGYLVLVLVFAGFYELAGVKSASGHSIDFEKILYFSGVTQSTVGFGDLLPSSKVSEVGTIAQAIVGVGYFSVATALIIARLLLPSVRGLTWADCAFFNPIRHQFYIGLINNRSTELRRITCGFRWARAASGSPELDPSCIPYAIPPKSSVELRSMAVRLIPSDGRIGDLRPNPRISPQPAEIFEDQALVVEVSFTTPLLTEVTFAKEYDHAHLMCGVVVDGYQIRPDTNDEMGRYCSHRCVFGLSCQLVNKRSGTGASWVHAAPP